jgi:apoptosis-inducing factor 2
LPDVLDEASLFRSIPKLFAHYPKDKFTFILGKATSLDADANKVTVTLNSDSNNDNNKQETIDYHTLVIATGSDSRDGMPWKNLATSSDTHAAIASLRERIAAASSIVVGGAGATGVEVAGELGSQYGRAGTKSITLIASDSQLLEPRIIQATRDGARRELEKFHVNIVTDTKVASTSTSTPTSTSTSTSTSTPTQTADGHPQTVLELSNSATGESSTLTTDLFIPTYGLSFNTAFVPREWLSMTSPGRIEVDSHLRVPTHKNIVVVGDASARQEAQAAKAGDQVKWLMRSFFLPHLKGPAAIDATDGYKANEGVVYGVALGPGNGVGQMGNMKPFNFIITWFKSKKLALDGFDAYAKGIKNISGGW